VNYLSSRDARNQRLARYIGDQIFVGVDNTTVLSERGAGRGSIRLESKRIINGGLLVADIAHMPGNACGIWPAFWTFNFAEDPYGEIDVIEGSMFQRENRFSLHTCSSCSYHVPSNSSYRARLRSDCNLHADERCENATNA